MRLGGKRSWDLLNIGIIRRLVRLPYFQFLLLAPAMAFFILAAVTIIFGVQHPAYNFGMVFTWVVWWGMLIIMFVVVGRGWCAMCPFGAFGEWVQRLSLWWRRNWSLGFNFKYPRRLKNLWLAIGIFVIFIFLDNGFGLSNSPPLTVGLIAVLILGAIWVSLFYERRTFCLYHCPLTVLIGMSSMMAPLEIRRKDADTCRQCKDKACYNGNDHAYGCPTFEFQGRGMDSNRNCTLCTECIRACPHDNIAINVRGVGRDLWARKKGRLDESVAAVIITGLVSMVPLSLVLFLPGVKSFMETVLPAGTPPADWPRLVSIGLLFLAGLVGALLLVYGFSYLGRRFSGSQATGTKAFFIHFAYAVIPLGAMKFIADILDHIFRTWGAVGGVIGGLFQDFPLNRIAPEEIAIRQLMTADQTYVLQVVLIAIGLGLSFFVAYRLAGRMFAEKETAFRAFVPVGASVLVMGMAAMWSLSAAL